MLSADLKNAICCLLLFVVVVFVVVDFFWKWVQELQYRM